MTRNQYIEILGWHNRWIGSFLDRPANAWRMQTNAKANTVNAAANVKIALALGLH